jgi:hypothetical protein
MPNFTWKTTSRVVQLAPTYSSWSCICSALFAPYLIGRYMWGHDGHTISKFSGTHFAITVAETNIGCRGKFPQESIGSKVLCPDTTVQPRQCIPTSKSHLVHDVPLPRYSSIQTYPNRSQPVPATPVRFHKRSRLPYAVQCGYSAELPSPHSSTLPKYGYVNCFHGESPTRQRSGQPRSRPY